jgi:hypothetical protein
MIAFIKLHMRTVERDTNAVEPRFAKLCQPFWKTPIGIEVNRSPIRFFSKEKDRVFQKPPLGQWFSLTTLTEADNRILRFIQMGQSHLQDLIDSRDKINPLL